MFFNCFPIMQATADNIPYVYVHNEMKGLLTGAIFVLPLLSDFKGNLYSAIFVLFNRKFSYTTRWPPVLFKTQTQSSQDNSRTDFAGENYKIFSSPAFDKRCLFFYLKLLSKVTTVFGFTLSLDQTFIDMC